LQTFNVWAGGGLQGCGGVVGATAVTWTASEPAVRVLGSVSVEVDGRAVPIGGPLPRRLLAVLLANRGAVVSVDRLVEVLWGDEPSETSTSSLHGYVSRLRRLLPPSVQLETAAPGYRLHLSPGAADVERFEAALGEALACLTVRPEAALGGGWRRR
jgi:DNA-binding SARP family transcriptional activator